MKIIEYEEKYLDDVKDLLVELEEYILSIDEDDLDQLHPEYRDKMALIDLEEVDYKCPKCGEVTELVVAKETRGKGVGRKLMQVVEEYFKSIGCEYISIEVFAYNKNAIKFYESEGYHTRGLMDIKKI